MNRNQLNDFPKLDGFNLRKEQGTGETPASAAIDSAFSLRNAKNFKGLNALNNKAHDLHTATHRYDAKAQAELLMGSQDESALPTPTCETSALLPLGSAIPRMNPIILNKNIQ